MGSVHVHIDSCPANCSTNQTSTGAQIAAAAESTLLLSLCICVSNVDELRDHRFPCSPTFAPHTRLCDEYMTSSYQPAGASSPHPCYSLHPSMLTAPIPNSFIPICFLLERASARLLPLISTFFFSHSTYDPTSQIPQLFFFVLFQSWRLCCA